MDNLKQLECFLSENRHNYCDDCLSELADITPRQQVNQLCNSNLDIFMKQNNIQV